MNEIKMYIFHCVCIMVSFLSLPSFSQVSSQSGGWVNIDAGNNNQDCRSYKHSYKKLIVR
jgi:hypothetical protein